MNSVARRISMVAAGLLVATLAWTPAAAQLRKTVDGCIVDLGIVPAAEALKASGHREAHPLHPPPGSQHLLVTLDDEKSGKRIGDADVVVEVTDPHGRVERKQMLHTQAGGFPDFSELFVFDWTGKYSIRVIVTLHPGNKSFETHFTVDHVI